MPKLGNLQVLRLAYDTPAGADGYERMEPKILRTLANLHTLALDKIKGVTDEDLQYLPNLRTLTLHSPTSIRDEGLNRLSGQLISLDVADNYEITNRALKNMTKLTYLNVSGVYSITDIALKNLTQLITLKIMDDEEHNMNMTSEGLRPLKQLKELYVTKNLMTRKEILELQEEGFLKCFEMFRNIRNIYILIYAKKIDTIKNK